MSRPRKPVLESTTTQNVYGGAVVSGTLAYALAVALCQALGLEPSPEIVAAITTVFTVVGTGLLSRLIASVRG